MSPIALTRRRVLLGGVGLLAYSGTAYWSITERIMRAEVPLYGETVAFGGGGSREIVPVGRVDAVVPGTRVLADRVQTAALLEEEQAWLASCAPWVQTCLDAGDDVLRSALLDLRALSADLKVSVAGWTDRWRYAWPRDVSFVAAALARVGHHDAAADQLRWLRGVQGRDGGFEARYDPSTRRPPDDRVAQLDGTGWVVWGAAQIAAQSPERATELPIRKHFGPTPIGPTEADVEVLTAIDRAQTSMLRPAGGLAPGASWKNDGISWTPTTALFAAAWAANGYPTKAEILLTWLGDHRTEAGSYPEKVLHDGRPAAVAPLAWPASLVVIATHALVRG